MYDNLERLKKLPGSLSSGTASIGCGWDPALELGIGVVQFTIQFPANDHRVPTRDSLASRL